MISIDQIKIACVDNGILRMSSLLMRKIEIRDGGMMLENIEIRILFSKIPFEIEKYMSLLISTI